MDEDQERDRAFKVAYTQGRRDADVDSHLRSHENRLNAINGSIEKHAHQAAALEATIVKTREALEDKIDALARAIATRDAVEADRTAQLRRANEKQISTKQFWLGIATICTMILIAVYARAHGVA